MTNAYKSTGSWCYSYPLDCSSNPPDLGATPPGDVGVELAMIDPQLPCECGDDTSCGSSDDPSSSECCGAGSSSGSGSGGGGGGGNKGHLIGGGRGTAL